MHVIINMNNKMKVLIFTSSHYKRGGMLRYSLLDVLNQSYKDFTYALSLKLDEVKPNLYSRLVDDLLDERIIYTEMINHKVCFSHFNLIDTIKSVPNYRDYDIFIKMDDDDTHKKDYVKNIVEFFESNPDTDIVSSKISTQLNGYSLFKNDSGYETLGRVMEGDNYNMPMTFAFNKKALEAIINLTAEDIGGEWDDMVQRKTWIKAGLVHKTVENKDNIIWNVHGKNASTSDFLISQT